MILPTAAKHESNRKASLGKHKQQKYSTCNVFIVTTSNSTVQIIMIMDITARKFVLLGKIVRTSGLQNSGYAVINTTSPFLLRSYTNLSVSIGMVRMYPCLLKNKNSPMGCLNCFINTLLPRFCFSFLSGDFHVFLTRCQTVLKFVLGKNCVFILRG